MKIIFMPPHKGWFKGLGLHHAAITAGFIVACHFIGLGSIGAAIAIGWYGSREWGPQLGFPKTFEIMDFISPTFISAIYLIFGAD